LSVWNEQILIVRNPFLPNF